MRHGLTLGMLGAAMALAMPTTNAFAQGSSPASPASPPDAITQKLYDAATSEMDAGDYESACAALEEVNRRVPDGVGARLTLAECYEGGDRLASALLNYTTAASLAERASQADRHTKALRKIEELKKRTATLRINLPAPLRALTGITVLLDGKTIDDSDWGTLIPVDKGTHKVEVSAPSRESFDVALVITKDGEARELAPTLESRTAAAVSVSRPPSRRAWQLPTGIATTVAGVATAAIGFGFGAVALSRKSAAASDCSASLACSSEGMTLRQEGRTFANASTALLVIGGVATGAGIVALATLPSREAQKRGTSASLIVGPLSVGVQGDFD